MGMDSHSTGGIMKGRFQFAEHPWISLLVLNLLTLFLIILAGSLGLSNVNFLFYHVLMLFVIVPFVLRLPNGRRSFKDYLDDIRLSRVRPLLPLLLLGFSCYVIMLVCQATGSIVYGLTQGQPLTGSFLRYVFDITVELPPNSWSLVTSMPSMFEEVGSRGVVLTLFLRHYSKRKSIAFSAVGFGLMHLLNLLSGREAVWVLGQVVWSSILGLFYGYIVLKSDSLLPAMLVHWLGNSFIYAFTRYIQINASIEVQVLNGVVFFLGLIPTTLMILWTRFLVARWPLLRNQSMSCA
jgi:membrane protease YdiL (CAAX protease family)